jgi:hypothetical protein
MNGVDKTSKITIGKFEFIDNLLTKYKYLYRAIS